MSWLDGLRFRLRTLLAPDRHAAELDEEVRFHLELDAMQAEHAGRGRLTTGDARHRAHRRFGNRAATAEAARAAAGLAWHDGVRQDVRLAWRGLGRAPGFAAGAMLVLALGLGVNATMAGLVDRLLVRQPAGVAEPERVVRVYGRNWWTAVTRSYPDYLDLRDGARLLAGVAAYQPVTGTLRDPERRALEVHRVSASYFPTLGVRLAAGRGILPAEEGAASGAPEGRVAVLSHRLAAQLLAAGATADAPAASTAADVIGREVGIGRGTYRVVGVAPPSFGGVHDAPADVWLPLPPLERDRGNYGAVHVVARLGADVTLAAADAEANRLNRAGQAADGLDADADVMQLGPLRLTQGPAAPPEVRVTAALAVVATLVLLLAAANVGHLLLARAVARDGETAMRYALGASRGRLARQWLVEGLVLGAGAGALALGVVAAAGAALRWLEIPAVSRAVEMDARLLALLAAGAVGTGLACGALPALRTAPRRLVARVVTGARPGGTEAPREARWRAALLALQVAVTAALLVGAGQFARSLWNVRHVDFGFDLDRQLLVTLAPSDDAPSGATLDSLVRRLAERARGLPAVAAVSAVHTAPFHSGWRTRLHVPGRDPALSGAEGGGRYNRISTFVDPAYREATGLVLVAGRWLAATDRAGHEPVVVLNEVLAGELWPGRPPAAALGACLHVAEPDAPCSRVVGVVRATRVESVFDAPPGQYYLALDQPRREEGATALLVRTADPARAAAGVRAALQAGLAPGLEVTARPLRANVDPVQRPWTIGAAVFGAFGALALAVAAAGLFGVVALLVAERTRELGVRRALGAPAGALVGVVARRVWTPAAAGIAAGLALGVLGTRAFGDLLFAVRAADPFGYVVAALVLGVVALAAGGIPARRAARVDPMRVLRGE